jgi:hypothetical protein
MTGPRTQFEGVWADGSKAVLDVGPLPTISGLRVSIAAEGGWPGLQDAEMRLTPGVAAELADALFQIAAPEVPAIGEIRTGFPGSTGGPEFRGWLFDPDALT